MIVAPPPTPPAPTSPAPTPIEIRLQRSERRLDVSFDDGVQVSLPAEYLRVESPSAEVQGHHPSERKVVPGCRNVGIASVEPIGHYAIRLTFDDGHDTGIYSWELLYTLGQEHGIRWQRYLDALAEKGLSRDR